MPRSAPNRFSTLNSAGRTTRLARFDLGEIEQVVDQLRELFRRFADVEDLRRRLASEPLAVVEHQVRQPEDRVHRRAELVGHVREEARLQLVGAAEMIRLLIELGVERDDAAVGVFQLAIEVDQLLLLALEVVERAQQRLVLLLDFLHEPGRLLARDRLGDLPGAFTRSRARAAATGTSRAPPSCRSGEVWMLKPSISRRAPTMPMPMPVPD